MHIDVYLYLLTESLLLIGSWFIYLFLSIRMIKDSVNIVVITASNNVVGRLFMKNSNDFI